MTKVSNWAAYEAEPTIAVVIPPRNTRLLSAAFVANPSPRDTHLLMIESMGRLGWREISGYGQRALVETAMGRYKSIVGTRLRARDWLGQKTEAAIGVAVLNRMPAAGRPSPRCTNAHAIRYGPCCHVQVFPT